MPGQPAERLDLPQKGQNPKGLPDNHRQLHTGGEATLPNRRTERGAYKEVFNSDDMVWGGSGQTNSGIVHVEHFPAQSKVFTGTQAAAFGCGVFEEGWSGLAQSQVSCSKQTFLHHWSETYCKGDLKISQKGTII